jgi:hypothetical protein
LPWNLTGPTVSPAQVTTFPLDPTEFIGVPVWTAAPGNILLHTEPTDLSTSAVFSLQQVDGIEFCMFIVLFTRLIIDASLLSLL